jgi:hypothetical protein
MKLYKYLIAVGIIVTVFVVVCLVVSLVNMVIVKQSVRSELFEIPFHIERTNEDGPTEIGRVPLTIYQSWHSNQVATKMRDTVYRLLDANPEFDYYLYSDDACRRFIEMNYDEEVVSAFNTLKPGAYKSDLWRYCIMYKRGGVYIDIKYYSAVPLIDIIKKNPVIFTRDRPHYCANMKDITGVYNAFMVSPPNNKVFKKCIDEIVESCKLKLYRSNSLDITGPCQLSRMMDSSIDINTLPTYHGYDLNVIFSLFTPQGVVYYKGKRILVSYPEYRDEQKLFQKSAHYSKLWDTKDVYN